MSFLGHLEEGLEMTSRELHGGRPHIADPHPTPHPADLHPTPEPHPHGPEPSPHVETAAAGAERSTARTEPRAEPRNEGLQRNRGFFENYDRFMRGNADILFTVVKASVVAVGAGLAFSRFLSVEKKAEDALRHLGEDVEKGGKAVVHEFDHLIHEGANAVVGSGVGGTAKSVVEGVLGVVIVGGVLYIVYEGYRFVRKF